MAKKTAREGAEDMQQEDAEAAVGTAAAAGGGGGNSNDGDFIEAGDIAAEFEVR